MSETMRLFIGIELDGQLRARLAHEAGRLSARLRGSFSATANYHITLAFLGGHGPEELAAIRAAMDEACARPPFEVRVGGLGSFRKGNRQIVWAGVEKSPELAELQGALADALRARGVAFADEGEYRPHITLARQCELAALPHLEWRRALSVERIALFESARREGELRYTPLEYARLSGRR